VTGTGRLTLASLDGIREAAAAARRRVMNKGQEVRLDPKAATQGVIRPH